MRSSVDKAEWFEETEEWYRKECDKMFYKKDAQLEVLDGDIYLVSENDKILFLTPTKSGKMWYET